MDWHGNRLQLLHIRARETVDELDRVGWIPSWLQCQLWLLILTAEDALCPAPILLSFPQHQTPFRLFSDPKFSFSTLAHTDQTWGKGLDMKPTACGSAWSEGSQIPPLCLLKNTQRALKERQQ